jgi:hypothetical protein
MSGRRGCLAASSRRLGFGAGSSRPHSNAADGQEEI